MRSNNSKQRSANNLRGTLIFGESGAVFRVKDPNHEEGFIDYEIRNNDLEVMILDEDAFIKQVTTADGVIDYIDYSNETLG